MPVEDAIDGPDRTAPPKTGAGKPAKTAGSLTLSRAILGAWGDLFRSREALLIRLYSPWIGGAGDDLISPVSLDEVRRRFEAATGTQHPSEAAREAHESRLALVARISAAWIVFWSTLGPAAVVAVFCARMIVGAPARVPIASRIVTAIWGAAVMFPLFLIAGMAIQSLLIRPFTWTLNRLFIGRPPAIHRSQGGGSSSEP